MSFDTDFNAAFDDIISTSGKPVQVRTTHGELITTRATIDKPAQLQGDFESGAMEFTVEISLQRSVVGVPERGWVVKDLETGEEYTLQDLLEGSDQFETRMSAK